MQVKGHVVNECSRRPDGQRSGPSTRISTSPMARSCGEERRWPLPDHLLG